MSGAWGKGPPPGGEKGRGTPPGGTPGRGSSSGRGTGAWGRGAPAAPAGRSATARSSARPKAGRGGGSSLGKIASMGGASSTRVKKSSGGTASLSQSGPVTKAKSLANMIMADVTPNFRFYVYGINVSEKNHVQIDSIRHRADLFNKAMFDLPNAWMTRHNMSKKEVESFKRSVFFEGSSCFSSRPIPGLGSDNLPAFLLVGEGEGSDLPVSENGDYIQIVQVQGYSAPSEITPKKSAASSDEAVVDRRCANCSTSFQTHRALMKHCTDTEHSPILEGGGDAVIPASKELFLAFCNVALQRALGERMLRWGREYIEPTSVAEHFGVNVYRAFLCEFGMHVVDTGASSSASKKKDVSLTLTVDLKAKIQRTKTVLDELYQNNNPNTHRFTPSQQNQLKKYWVGQVVICTYDKKCYSVVDLLFDESPTSKPVDAASKLSHTQYFEQKKGLILKYPKTKPLIAVLGRRNSTIYLPAEFVCGNELDPKLKMKLPQITSFTPIQHHEALEEVKRFLEPGAQKTKGVGGGLLPALGVILKTDRVSVPVDIVPLPIIIAAGVRIPDKLKHMWSPAISAANFNVNPNHALTLNPILIYHKDLQNSYLTVFDRLKEIVNKFNASFRISPKPFATIQVGDFERHWGEVEKYFGGTKMPPNVFVIDFHKPSKRSATDPVYAVVKQMLGKAGYLSQFVNFNTYDHSYPRDMKKSTIILQGVARQILSKSGFRIWWIKIPRNIPLPTVFVGVDVFHAPRRYDPQLKKRVAKESIAAVIVQVIKSPDDPKVYIYSETAKREMGQEIDLGEVMKEVVSRALKYIKVSPMSCVVWRDGVGDATIAQVAANEIPHLRKALTTTGVVGTTSKKKNVPLSYIVCQKRIATKFLSTDGKTSMPCGSIVTALKSSAYDTFYINGTSPPYSTSKPVRFVIVSDEIPNTIMDLTWCLCHDYANWCGPIKLPAPVQMAHKLAELAGTFQDCGETISHETFLNKIHFL